MKTSNKKKLRSKNGRTKEDIINKLIVDKGLSTDKSFFNYFKVSPKQFEHLFSLIETRFKKKDLNLEGSTTSRDFLAMTLRYLSGRDLIRDLSNSFQIEKSSVLAIVTETCEAITDVLLPLVMPKPSTERWMKIAQEFKQLWEIPHCLGAIDVKHFEMQISSGLKWTHYNRKGIFALTLLAVVDSDYNFILVDAGAPGHLSDKKILENSNIGHQLQQRLLFLPSPEVIPETNITMPYSFIGDEGFPLQDILMRPYQGPSLSEGQKVFNDKLYRARRCVENAFGLMTAHFRIFQSPMSVQVETAVAMVEAATCLHNYIMSSEASVSVCQRLYNPGKIS